MTKYTPEMKLEIVKSVLDDGLTVGEASRKYNAGKGDIRKWVAAYQVHGMAGIARQQTCYTGEFKQEAVEYMIANKLSMRETTAKYNLGCHDVISKWERIYMHEGPEGLYKEHRGGASDVNIRKVQSRKLDKTLEEDLIAENQRLRMENDYLKKLNALVQEREKSELKKKSR